MRCPKCGYLGFEATDRCRNCGYDFSLSSPLPTGELPLRSSSPEGPLGDLELGAPAHAAPLPGADTEASGFGRRVPRQPATAAALSASSPTPVAIAPASPAADASENVEELPLFAPRPAGTPLAVRRAGAEVPRARRSTTRPMRVEEPVLPLVADTTATGKEPQAVAARSARSAAPEAAGAVARVAAALVDTVLLAGIDAAVFWLTLRIAGLESTPEGVGTIRLAPMAAFFTVLAFLYLVGFTVGGGQTIGKMLTGIRVTGDDGFGVDLTGAVVRALGCLASVLTLGVLYVPAFVGADRRAVHDRMAGTRVVRG